MFETKFRWVKFADSEKDLQNMLMGKSCGPQRINGKAVLLVRHQNEYFLVKNKCPHQGITLEKSTCEDGFIVCLWHRYGFDLKTRKKRRRILRRIRICEFILTNIFYPRKTCFVNIILMVFNKLEKSLHHWCQFFLFEPNQIPRCFHWQPFHWNYR